MRMTRREALILLASAGAIPAGRGFAQSAGPDERVIEEAYIYLLGRALVIRQEHTDRRVADFAYNRIRYNPLGSADFVNPNFDVAYLEAWIAVDERSPALLEVPEIRGRYYTAQILDEWGEVIANVNERNFPSKPFGTFALMKPGSTAAVPPGAGRIELHSGKAKLLGRVELKDDRDGAVRLQHAFRLSSSGQPIIAEPPAIPDFSNRQLIDARIFEHAEAILASALDVSPAAAAMQEKVRWVAAQANQGAAGLARINAALPAASRALLDYVETGGKPRGAPWTLWDNGGNYGADWLRRTAVNYGGLWANTPEEVVYFSASQGPDGRPFDGSGSYVMHFAANRLPDAVVEAYWSVILVTVPDYRVVPNALNRFNFNNHSPLTREADGSLKLAIGPRPVAAVPESNWLPSPEGKPFSLIFRTYVPKEIVRRGEWQPAPVTRLP